ncbi:50S ribosomal protein L21 [Qingshengfaniella alkalisoli]|uniref:Large ribosomal subunit protein bL21 n=1 Tax=Qingshengfaniella alkalisoli TaxID=2599296 RepID=A0A5B8ITZ7_9RHOB|nr:50S ribosomal protein L21 [Qingshengfaniella alkalisoli]QDY68943.1 50S ribosomal protein L21 [Qingshengfaniella alkalisoli]
MFAVLKTGGKQYKVQSGDVLRVEKLEAAAGETVQFNEILMIGGDDLTVGSPFVDGAAVNAEVIDQIKGDKVINFVKRRRKHSSQRTRGHRQQLTLLRVTDILANGAKAPAKAKKAAPKVEAAAETTGTKPANLLTEAREGGADDLKKISGVGPKLEGLLNENGVYHYDQIAAWNAEEIAFMDEQLSFKGRIERDGWTDQASKLAAEKE